MYQKTTLPNGLRVVTSPMPTTRSASILIFVGVGSRYEDEAHAGISHFIEHMLFKGTPRRPTAREVSQEIEGVGGILNAATDREATVYWAKVPRLAYEDSADCLVDMLRNSVFDSNEIEKERKVIIEELNMVADSPGQLVDQLIDETLWPDQPLGRDIAGSKESVSGITRDMQLAFLANHYSPANVVVSVAGNVSHDENVALIDRLLGSWSGSAKGEMYPAKSAPRGPRARLFTKRTEQAHLCLAVPAYDSHHPDRYALDILNVILGEGMSSRLFVALREERGLCYDVHSYVSRFRDTGSLTVYAGVDPKNADSTISAVLEQLVRFRDEPLPADEFKKAKTLIKGRLMLRLEDTRSVASSFGNQELMFGTILTADEIVERIDAVQPEDVSRVAADLFQTAKLNLAIVGNFRKLERFEARLAI